MKQGKWIANVLLGECLSIAANPLTMSCLPPTTIRFRRSFACLVWELRQLVVALASMKAVLLIPPENYALVSECFPTQLCMESLEDEWVPLPVEGLPSAP